MELQAWHDATLHDAARLGEVQQRWLGVACTGKAWLGLTWQGRQGEDRLGDQRHGIAGAARHVKALSGATWRG